MSDNLNKADVKHTAGPWRVVNRARAIAGPKGNGEVARVSERFMDRAERGANAHLIAAAPTLLEALEGIVSGLADQDEEGLIEHAPEMEAARAAIALAKGEKVDG